jgi:hypothetical protein
MSRSQDLQVVGHDWSVNQYGRAIHSFTINNSGQSTYQNVVMNIHYFARTGEPLHNETVTMSEFFPSNWVTTITIIHSASLGATRATASIAIAGAEEKIFLWSTRRVCQRYGETELSGMTILSAGKGIMNQEEFKQKWDRFCQDLQAYWEGFADEDLLRVNGEHRYFNLLVQQRYPHRKEEVSNWVDRWFLLDRSYEVAVRRRESNLGCPSYSL